MNLSCITHAIDNHDKNASKHYQIFQLFQCQPFFPAQIKLFKNSFTILNSSTDRVQSLRIPPISLLLTSFEGVCRFDNPVKVSHFFILFTDFVTMFWKFPNLYRKTFRDKTMTPDPQFLMNCMRHF